MPDLELIEYDVNNNAAILTIDSTENQNALSSQLISDLSTALQTAESDDSVRVVVMKGKDDVFCAGANIDEFEFDGAKAMMGRIISDEGHRKPFDIIENLDKPVIAAINGTAMGAGFELALVSDLVIVGEDVRMGLPEVKIGAAPGIAMVRLPDIIDHHKAMNLMLTGKHISGKEAVSMGLFNEAVPNDDVEEVVNDYVAELTNAAPVSLTVIKKVVNRHRGSEDNFVGDLGMGILFETDDIKEGTQAFKEKRNPDFDGS